MTKADKVDPELISFMEWPCVCGVWVTVRWWHRLWAKHRYKLAVRINRDRRFIAQDGEVGSVLRSENDMA